eukprot:c17966_g1_i3.p1 GENE.c17966_g1_i3~~c17966_g1_i3.p1  ORF type:complete len:277 (+),score=73.45 c17966_g1_i3:43-873(+)
MSSEISPLFFSKVGKSLIYELLKCGGSQFSDILRQLQRKWSIEFDLNYVTSLVSCDMIENVENYIYSFLSQSPIPCEEKEILQTKWMLRQERFLSLVERSLDVEAIKYLQNEVVTLSIILSKVNTAKEMASLFGVDEKNRQEEIRIRFGTKDERLQKFRTLVSTLVLKYQTTLPKISINIDGLNLHCFPQSTEKEFDSSKTQEEPQSVIQKSSVSKEQENRFLEDDSRQIANLSPQSSPKPLAEDSESSHIENSTEDETEVSSQLNLTPASQSGKH